MYREGFLYSGDELAALAGAHNYYGWIMQYFTPHLGQRVIEVGAGVGNLSTFLLSGNGVAELVLTEPAENLFPLLQERFSKNTKVRPLKGYIEDFTGFLTADSVVIVNVLEHTPDDWVTLQAIHKILAPGGAALIFVPALPWLYGTLDEEFEHFRRYTKSQLHDLLVKTGFHIESLRYFNFPGILTWFVAGRILRRKTIRPGDVRVYDRWVVPWASRLEEFWEPPLGQSLLAIAKK